MAEETKNSQPTSATGGGDHETRIADLEKRLNQLETQQLGRSGNEADGADAETVAAQAKRLAKLEERHENLLRYTPDAREEPNAWEWIWLIVIAIIIIYAFASGR
jgi:hypothetical protein